MSDTAVLSKPYWRWHRWHRRRGTFKRSTVPAKPWNGLVTVLLVVPSLVVIDQWTKHSLTTPDWAWHPRPDSIYLYKAFGLALAIPFLFFSITRLAAMLMAAGTIGNLVSLLATDNRVANPFVMQDGDTRIAFNVADLLLFAAFAVSIYVAAQLIVLTTRRQTP